MTEPRIVDAVEVAQPDYWIGVSVSHGTVHLWSNIPRKSSDELMESAKRFGASPQFIVRLPGTPAPAPATATDAEIDLILNRLHAAKVFARDGDFETAQHFIVESMERLAKIRGAK